MFVSAFVALLSSIVWGTSDYLGGMLARRRPAIAVVGGSQPFGLIAATTTALVLQRWEFNSSIIRNGIAAGVFGLIGLVAFYTALGSGRMGIVSPISSLGVLIPLIIALARGEQPTTLQMIGIAAAVIGIVLASGPELSGGASPKPVLLAFTAAFMFGFSIYFMAQGGAVNPSMTTVVMRFVQVILAFTAALVLRSVGGLQRRDLPWLIVIGSTDALANILFTFAASWGLLSITSVLGSLFPVMTVILAWGLAKERLAPIQYLGVAATIGGVIAITAG